MAGETFIVRSPLDGYVIAVPVIGSELRPVSYTAAQLSFDRLGYRFADDPNAYRPNFLPANSPELSSPSPARPDDAPLVIKSPPLELQLLQASANVESAQQRLDSEREKFALESAIGPRDQERLNRMTLYEAQKIEWERRKEKVGFMGWEFGVRRPDGTEVTYLDPEGRRLSKNGAMARLIAEDIANERRRFLLQREWQAKLDASTRDLEAAERSLEILQATASTGEISFPSPCRVLLSHVYRGQFVTRGDPIVDVQFI